jgi:protein-S-isoprenylcysteine O-methyltransferase Ste14
VFQAEPDFRESPRGKLSGEQISSSMQDVTAQFINLCFAIFILYWIVSAFWTKPTLKGQRGGQWRLIGLIIALVLLFVFRRPLGIRGGPVLWRHTPFVGIIADIIALCGLIIVLWARTTLGGNWSANVVIKEDHELIQRGPYAYVRHPIYSGLLLMTLALVINNGRLAWFIVFALICLGVYFKARREEELLTKHFPESYPKYMTKVKALIPFVL